MADQRLTQLSTATTLANSDLFYVVQSVTGTNGSSAKITFQDLNSQIGGGGGSGTISGAKVFRSTTQSIPNTTVTAISFDTELYDTDNYWTVGSPTIFTIPATGTYLISACIAFTAGSAVQGSLLMEVNGAATSARNSHNMMTGGNQTFYNVSTIISATAGDTVTVNAFQATGGNLNTDSVSGSVPIMAIERLR